MSERENRTKTRDAHGRWLKGGASPNPGGRPVRLVHVRELAREHTVEAVETLVAVMKHGDRDSARVAAAIAILDRGWGKAPAEIRVDAAVPSLEQRIRNMTPRQRQQRIEELEAKALAGMSPEKRAEWFRSLEAKVREMTPDETH